MPGDASSKGDQLYHLLREQIFSGRLLPGDPIKEKGWSYSQATVRQALLRLEREGLVVRRPHRDTTVVNLSKTDVRNLIAVRTALEVLAFKDARQKLADAAVRARAEHHLRRIADSPRGDERFHHFLWELSDNAVLVRTLKDLCTPMFAFVVLLRSKGLQRQGDRLASHKALLDALVNADPKTLERTLGNHIESAYAAFLESEVSNMRELARTASLDPASTASSRVVPVLSKHREFLRWVPAIALVVDRDYRVVYANEEFERSSGRRLEQLLATRLADPYWAGLHERVIRRRQAMLVLSRPGASHRVTVCFPMDVDGEPMMGELGFDVTQLLGWIEAPTLLPQQIITVPPADNLASQVPVAGEVLSAFFDALPGIATWKDLQGRLLWANPEYAHRTGKQTSRVLGLSPLENWPASIGARIMAHDAMVRETQLPYVTYDVFPAAAGETRRVAIRFPLFNRDLQVAETASLVFDYELIQRSVKVVRRLGERRMTSVPLDTRRQRSGDAASGAAAH